MSNSGRYAGMRALAAKLGLGASTSALSAAGAGGGDAEDRDDEDGEADAAEQPKAPTHGGNDAGDDGAGDAGDDGEGDDDGDDEDDDAAGDEGGDADGDDAGAGEGGQTSAEYRRGFSAGEQATAGRWAATFLNASCRANLELATDLLADTNMTPDKIAAYCSRNPGKAGGMERLATTPKPKIGLEGGNGGDGTLGDRDEAKETRRAATARVNANVRRRAGKGGATRKAGGPGGSVKDDAAAAGGAQ